MSTIEAADSEVQQIKENETIREESGAHVQQDEPHSSSSSNQLNKNLVLNTKETIYELYKPVVYEIEQYCGNLKNSQMILNRQLEDFFQSLRDLKFKLENDKLSEQLDENAKKVLAIKRKLTLIHTIIQNSDDRCKRLLAKYMPKESVENRRDG